jgi:Double-GTPase 2
VNVRSCPRENCFAPETGCILGRESCELFGEAAEVAAEGTQLQDPTSALPWSGLALGSADVAAVAALGGSRVVGLVGLSDAGKTTALAAAQLARRRSDLGGFGEFAGSYTLMGWHQIMRHLEWAPWGQGFPPHTELRSGRTPALLHVALACAGGSIRQVLYTDVPGEWYARWAFDSSAEPGVSWIIEHADAFLLFADSQALAGPNRGVARAQYDALARRLASVAEGRSIVPVLSKADVELSPAIRASVDDVNRRVLGSETFPVSALQQNGRQLLAAIDRGTAAAISRDILTVPSTLDAGANGDVLFAYREAPK